MGGCNLNVLLGAPYNEQLPTLTTTAITGYILREGEERASLSKSKESINKSDDIDVSSCMTPWLWLRGDRVFTWRSIFTNHKLTGGAQRTLSITRRHRAGGETCTGRLAVSVTKTFVLSFHWPWSPGLAKLEINFCFYLPSKSGLGPSWIGVDHIVSHYLIIITGKLWGCATKSADAIVFCSKLFFRIYIWLIGFTMNN